MKNEEMAEDFRSLGFINADIEKDLGGKFSGLIYLTRIYNKQYQYLSLCSYEGNFCEAVFSVYDKLFNSRAKPPMIPIYVNLCRNKNELAEMVEKVYENKVKNK